MNSIAARYHDMPRHQLSTYHASDPTQMQTSSEQNAHGASVLLVSQACIGFRYKSRSGIPIFKTLKFITAVFLVLSAHLGTERERELVPELVPRGSGTGSQNQEHWRLEENRESE